MPSAVARRDRVWLRVVAAGFAGSVLACSLVVSGDLTGGALTTNLPEGGGQDSSTLDAPNEDVEAGPLTYAATVLDDGPVGYWRLGEKPGALSAKSEVGSFTCALNGPVTWGAPGAVAGDSDTALTLDGQGAIDCGDRFDFPGVHPYTIELWLHADTIDPTYRFLFAKRDDAADGGPATYALLVHQSEGLIFQRMFGGDDVHAFAPFATGSIFHHVVAVYSGTDVQLFLDGQFVTSTPDTRALPSIAAPLAIGCFVTGSPFGFFKGTLDEVALYDKALSPARIAAHFHAAGR